MVRTNISNFPLVIYITSHHITSPQTLKMTPSAIHCCNGDAWCWLIFLIRVLHYSWHTLSSDSDKYTPIQKCIVLVVRVCVWLYIVVLYLLIDVWQTFTSDCIPFISLLRSFSCHWNSWIVCVHCLLSCCSDRCEMQLWIAIRKKWDPFLSDPLWLVSQAFKFQNLCGRRLFVIL